jgi:Na+-driven multidrug efflux pump
LFMALVLDAVAIAAQALVGAALGAGGAAPAHGLARQVAGYGLGLGVLFGLEFAGLVGVLPGVFTTDAAVLAAIPVAWWFFVAMQPVAGVVFALDGVLLGAGDVEFLRTSTLAAAVLGFLPLVWASAALDWGLAGIWTGLTAFMLIRLVAVGLRARSDRWALTGAVRG